MLKKLKEDVEKVKKICEQNENINKRQETKRNQKEILELESTITEMKSSLEGFKSRFIRYKKESVNLNIGQWKLLSWRKRKKKIEEKKMEPEGPMGHHETDQHMPRGSPRRRGERKGAKRIFEKVMAGNSPNLMNDMNTNIQEPQ